MTTYEVLAILVAAATAVAIIGQVYLMVRTLKMDHERRKNQATIEFMLQVRPLWHQGRKALDERWGTEELTEAALQEIDNNEDAHETVRTLLGHLELLSVGVNSGVYDKALLRRMSGTHLTTIYRRLRPYIKKLQRKLPNAYVEFERLVEDFQVQAPRHNVVAPSVPTAASATSSNLASCAATAK